MARITKKQKTALAQFDRQKRHNLDEAVAAVKAAAYAKFDESVDVAVRLGVNPKHADQMVRGALVLPHGTGKKVRVLVFAKGEKEKEALDAGADVAGSDELVLKVQEGMLDFDRVIATPDMMGQVGKLGRILGPRGLMPNPKVGTVTFDVGSAVREAKAGKVEYRVDKAGVVHCRIGRVSFTPDVYAAAVAIVAPSNLITLLSTIPPYWEPAVAMFHKRMGDSEEVLKQQSPLFKADQIKAPLLIGQGANDPRVNKAESDQIVAAMRKNNKPVQYYVFPDEGHGFARPTNNMAFNAASEEFLAKYLGGRFEPATPDESKLLTSVKQ